MSNQECWACGSDVCVCAERSAKYATGLIEVAVKAEREACAKVCENFYRNGNWITKEEAAAAIRARGEK
jgi:hypothetical protein